jgi:hypothetical protein
MSALAAVVDASVFLLTYIAALYEATVEKVALAYANMGRENGRTPLSLSPFFGLHGQSQPMRAETVIGIRI